MNRKGRTMNRMWIRAAGAACLAASALILLGGCEHPYVTPGGAANLHLIREADIRERFETKPAAKWPVHMALVRVQESGYYSHSSTSYGSGAYSLVTARDVESDEQIKTIASLPQVAGLASVNQLLLPSQLQGLKELRIACASLHADMMLLYTFNTTFHIKGQSLGPLSVITLGFLPNKMAHVTTTVSGVLFDVRTSHVYGLAEASHTRQELANRWSTRQAIDNARLDTEKQAFAKFVTAFAQTWAGVVTQYGPKEGATPAPSAPSTPSAAAPPAAPAASYAVRCDKEGDGVAVLSGDSAVTFAVTSKRGIGSAVIRRTGGDWPARVILRLHLGGLESLTVGSEALALNVSVLSHGNNDVLQTLRRKGQTQTPPVPGDSEYRADLRVLDAEGKPVKGLPPKGGWFEIVLPKPLLEEAELQVQWIDFFR